MLENLNYELFYLLNATPSSPEWMIDLATFIAKDVISIVPALAVILWLWGPRTQVTAQRHLVIKMAMAIGVSVLASYVLGHAFPHDRPFVDRVGYNFLHHAPDDSFPSDHGTVIFTFALAFLFWHRLWSGVVLMGVAVAIAAVPRLPGRALAAGYGRRFPGGTDGLRQRSHPVEPLWSGALSWIITGLSRSVCPSNPQRLDT